MGNALHLIKGGDSELAVATVARQLAAGDTVTVVALHGAAVPALPPAVVVRRVPAQVTWEQLLEAMFEADQVITW